VTSVRLSMVVCMIFQNVVSLKVILKRFKCIVALADSLSQYRKKLRVCSLQDSMFVLFIGVLGRRMTMT